MLMHTQVFCDDINRNIVKGKFPVNLKKADITPLFKKLERILKSNYRAVSILPILRGLRENILSTNV